MTAAPMRWARVLVFLRSRRRAEMRPAHAATTRNAFRAEQAQCPARHYGDALVDVAAIVGRVALGRTIAGEADDDLIRLGIPLALGADGCGDTTFRHHRSAVLHDDRVGLEFDVVVAEDKRAAVRDVDRGEFELDAGGNCARERSDHVEVLRVGIRGLLQHLARRARRGRGIATFDRVVLLLRQSVRREHEHRRGSERQGGKRTCGELHARLVVSDPMRAGSHPGRARSDTRSQWRGSAPRNPWC